MSGTDIRKKIKAAGLKVWQVAEAFGCTDSTFSRKLRGTFNEEDTTKILKIIETLKTA